MAALPRIPAPKPIDDFEGWLSAFTQPTVLVEVLVEPVVVVMATDMVAAGARLLLQATGSSTSTPTSAQRHTMCR